MSNQPQYRPLNTQGIEDRRVRYALEQLDSILRAVTNFQRDLISTVKGQARLQGAVAPRQVDADPSTKVTFGVKNELVSYKGQIFQKTTDEAESRDWTAVTPPPFGYVPTTRAVNSGGLLTGGGDLTQDRTISLAESIDPNWTGTHDFSLATVIGLTADFAIDDGTSADDGEDGVGFDDGNSGRASVIASASDPGTGEGVWIDTSGGPGAYKYKAHNGTTWVELWEF